MPSSLSSVVGGRFLLNTGHPILLVGFGTYGVQSYVFFQLPGHRDLVLPPLDKAVDVGYRLIDLAKGYITKTSLEPH